MDKTKKQKNLTTLKNLKSDKTKKKINDFFALWQKIIILCLFILCYFSCSVVTSVTQRNPKKNQTPKSNKI